MKIAILSNNPGRSEAVEYACSGHDIHCWGHEQPSFVSLGYFDLMIVAGWPRKIEHFDQPTYGTWNCHAGPVPEYRGGSPLNWQIIDGREILEVSLLKMDAGWDTGPVIGCMKFRLFSNETIREAHEYANECFTAMVRQALAEFPPPMRDQPKSDAYKKQRTDEMGEISLDWEPQKIHNHVRALTHPYPGAWVRTPDGGKLRIWETTLVRPAS